MYAVTALNSRVVEFLLQSQADVNAQDNNGYTALMCAVKKGEIKIIKSLLDCKNLNVNIEDNARCTTALSIAVRKNYYDVTQCLLDFGADIDWRSASGVTLLMSCISYGGDLQLANLLVERGVDVDAQDNNGQTALMYAVTEPNSRVVEVLLQSQADVNAQDNSGYTALMLAVKKGEINIIKFLLDCNNIDIKIKDKAGITALSIAVSKNYYDVTQWLLDRGANIDWRSASGATLLMSCISNGGDLRLANLLVERGVDVDAQDNNGQTALMLAMQANRTDIVELLRANNLLHQSSAASLADGNDDGATRPSVFRR
jgi:ankyrin repeat protein